MSDFGADTSDFHSDYASDFRDFPGDFDGEPRTAKQPPETPGRHRRSSGRPPTRPQGHKGGKLVAHHKSSKPRRSEQHHAIGP